MPLQLELDLIPNGNVKVIDTGESLRNKGMEKAIKHANEVHESWSDRAYEFLLKFIKTHKEFMCEDVRIASARIVPEPPNLRSWGSIFYKAAKGGFIKNIGTKKVKNKKAHRANANLWRVV